MPEKGTLNVSSRKKLTKILKWALSHRQEPFRPGLVLLHRQAGINWPRSSCIPNTSSWRGILVRNRRQAGCSEAGRQSLGWAYLSFTTILHEAGSAWKETKVQRCEGTLGHSCLGAEETAVVCVFRAMQVVALSSPVSYYHRALFWVGGHHTSLDSNNQVWRAGVAEWPAETTAEGLPLCRFSLSQSLAPPLCSVPSHPFLFSSAPKP